MALITYLNFRENTREALEFYTTAFQATDVRITTMAELGENPEHPLPENEKNMIANAALKFAGGVLMMSDAPESMGMPFIVGNNVSLSVVLDDAKLIRTFFENLAIDGQVIMPLAEVPWSPLYGMVIDKFGVGWQFNCTDDPYYY